MSTFFLILGIIALLIGLFVLIVGIADSDDDFVIGGVALGLGLICTIGSIVAKCSSDEPKTQGNAEVIVSDSTQVQVVPDSIYAVQFVITWKTDSEIKCGSDIILKGKTEKQVGDTITINLK